MSTESGFSNGSYLDMAAFGLHLGKAYWRRDGGTAPRALPVAEEIRYQLAIIETARDAVDVRRYAFALDLLRRSEEVSSLPGTRRALELCEEDLREGREGCSGDVLAAIVDALERQLSDHMER